MRNIIYTSLLGVFALAAPLFSAPIEGCFERQYSADHLKSHPDQVVEAIWLRFKDWNGEHVVEMSVYTANQGHAARAGLGEQFFDQLLFCGLGGSGNSCFVECDGGSIDITRDDGKVLEFITDGVFVGDSAECGGAINLAERPGEDVTYRLFRVDDGACETN